MLIDAPRPQDSAAAPKPRPTQTGGKGGRNRTPSVETLLMKEIPPSQSFHERARLGCTVRSGPVAEFRGTAVAGT